MNSQVGLPCSTLHKSFAKRAHSCYPAASEHSSAVAAAMAVCFDEFVWDAIDLSRFHGSRAEYQIACSALSEWIHQVNHGVVPKTLPRDGAQVHTALRLPIRVGLRVADGR